VRRKDSKKKRKRRKRTRKKTGLKGCRERRGNLLFWTRR
jgi:hypothetical protein